MSTLSPFVTPSPHPNAFPPEVSGTLGAELAVTDLCAGVTGWPYAAARLGRTVRAAR